MRFLSKIRERQFAKKWGGAYNLSRAVLAGVLAAGCLMPGFAEAAPAPALVTKLDHYITDNDNLITVDRTEGENTATITAVNGNVGDKIDISWMPGAGETSVEGCTINVNSITIEPEIHIYGGEGTTAAKGNSVSISGGTFNGNVRVWGGLSQSGTANKNRVIISGGKFYNRVYGGEGEKAADENRVIISGGKFSRCWVYGGYSLNGTANRNQVIISDGTFDGNVVGGSSTKEAKDNKIVLLGNNASYTFTNAHVR